ncbi:MAG: hypothetical protein HZB71_08930 [Betaproteobacteria bacterium]|nr:hypothetical protein [Betaproteobacteria bacterium]
MKFWNFVLAIFVANVLSFFFVFIVMNGYWNYKVEKAVKEFNKQMMMIPKNY